MWLVLRDAMSTEAISPCTTPLGVSCNRRNRRVAGGAQWRDTCLSHLFDRQNLTIPSLLIFSFFLFFLLLEFMLCERQELTVTTAERRNSFLWYNLFLFYLNPVYLFAYAYNFEN